MIAFLILTVGLFGSIYQIEAFSFCCSSYEERYISKKDTNDEDISTNKKSIPNDSTDEEENIFNGSTNRGFIPEQVVQRTSSQEYKSKGFEFLDKKKGGKS